jgi:hypothetical protein
MKGVDCSRQHPKAVVIDSFEQGGETETKPESSEVISANFTTTLYKPSCPRPTRINNKHTANSGFSLLGPGYDNKILLHSRGSCTTVGTVRVFVPDRWNILYHQSGSCSCRVPPSTCSKREACRKYGLLLHPECSGRCDIVHCR